MTAVAASAPGKIILFGEHAVVYGRPAIAVPVTQVQAKTMVVANPAGMPGQVEIDAPGIGLNTSLDRLPAEHPLTLAIQGVQSALNLSHLPSVRLRITSTIPIASGLGSGTAVTVAIVRALSAFIGHPLPDEQVNAIAFRVDQAHHGTPSGIDNTVITYAQPVYFVRGQPVERLSLSQPLTFVIGDCGIPSPTGLVVGDVRQRWSEDKDRYELIFDHIGALTSQARASLESGDIPAVGSWLNANHNLLQELDVSCPPLDQLINSAREAGALGAKLCGGGRGGNMIALVTPQQADHIALVLRRSGAVNTIVTQVR